MTTLAFALAATIKHDGHGGVADLLSTPAETAAWVADHRDLVTDVLGRPLELPGVAQRELVHVRRAVRALFAKAVAPGAPSKADADRLMEVEEALRVVNGAAGRLGTTYLEWDEEPRVRWACTTDDPI
jgi:hypothetical protein